jgi:hypothetical protein
MPTQAALVTASGTTELELVMADLAEDEELAEAALFLVAYAMRYHDAPYRAGTACMTISAPRVARG